ncbi:hypothetical protein TrCOL_g2295 [Triparma columacea]|uniref:Uncharacterized protein n=1 Tax=Triparma columacea TaxID=722753 RepID=A0A9W7G0K4_9STRA|nr:hypothetical protein TrCOL_g2295 [Triparma columacea]
MAVDTSMDPVTDSDEDMFCPEDVILDISADEWDESDASSDSDDDMEEEDDYDFKAERAKVLEIAQQQREVARWYLHPEDPVPSTLGARCFFDRASSDITYLNEVDESAPKGIVDVETVDEMQERAECLAAASAMKETVSWYLHPERPVTTNGNQSRCFFDRASSDITYLNEVDESAPKGIVDVETVDEMQERAECLAAASAMKETVSWYLHPERPVTTNGNTARCYFDRASAPEPMSKEDADDMAECLAAAAEMKERVSWYHHPSTPLKVDPTASARNYFDRASAPEQMEDDDADDMAACLAAAAEMKERVSWYLHPERPVTTNGNTARCYFHRASSDITYLNEVDETAPKGIIDVETVDEMQERAECLAAASAMKETVSWYLHPERPVTTNGIQSRCFFDRASAPEPMSKEDADDMADCLAAASAMKETVSWYLHPERPVTTNGNTGRCYFDRASAPEPMSKEDADDMADCLAAASAMKETVSWYLHPERPVTTNDNTARCYFDRASAPEPMSKEDADDMADCLAAAAEMKERVSWYHHPSTPLKVDPTASAHNYFQPDASQISTRRLRGESVMDQFEMEGIGGGQASCQAALFASLGAVAIDTSGSIDPDEDGSSEKEGNLSRSPSSVMLFEQAA